MIEKMTPEEISDAKKQLGEITAKITINFSKKGCGIDTTETGCSKKQVLMGALALMAMLDKNDFTHYISVIDDGERVFNLLKVIKDLKDNVDAEKENKDGVSE